jgi:hypothetical protein
VAAKRKEYGMERKMSRLAAVEGRLRLGKVGNRYVKKNQ